jgi:2-C-methyl-D-erythritol 4-phosphate cytidylyltransferase
VSWGAVIVAAGSGQRFGQPKQLIDIAGKPMLAWSVETFAAMPEVSTLVVTTEAEFVPSVETLVKRAASKLDTRVIVGGAERQDSVRLALVALSEGAGTGPQYAFIHDGARPMIRIEDVRRGMAVVAPGVGALLAIPVVDTIKQVNGSRKVTGTLDRAKLWAAQTPQFGMLDDLLRVHRAAQTQGIRVTDDAALLEDAGLAVIVVEGNAENFKVTVPADLARAELILRERAAV